MVSQKGFEGSAEATSELLACQRRVASVAYALNQSRLFSLSARVKRARVILFGLVFGSLLPACSPEETGADTVIQPLLTEELVIYSPAPPTIMLHTHNEAVGEALRACGVARNVRVVPMALPASINAINELDPSVKPYHLPIVTTLDFQPAIDASAPTWHSYDEANTDLRFVASLYEVAFGIMVADPEIKAPSGLVGKRIAVPARPSAVRWFSEVLLRDGWNILDEVTLVDMAPPDVPQALATGDIDAVAWNIMSETPDGYVPLLPRVFDVGDAHWLDVDGATLEAINQANPFVTGSVVVNSSRVSGDKGKTGPKATLLSFRQGLAAWASTPDSVVAQIVECLSGADLSFGSPAGFASDQFVWPGLSEDTVHPAARKSE